MGVPLFLKVFQKTLIKTPISDSHKSNLPTIPPEKIHKRGLTSREDCRIMKIIMWHILYERG